MTLLRMEGFILEEFGYCRSYLHRQKALDDPLRRIMRLIGFHAITMEIKGRDFIKETDLHSAK